MKDILSKMCILITAPGIGLFVWQLNKYNWVQTPVLSLIYHDVLFSYPQYGLQRAARIGTHKTLA